MRETGQLSLFGTKEFLYRVTKDEIDAKIADRAFYWTSFDPEKRALQARENFATMINKVADELEVRCPAGKEELLETRYLAFVDKAKSLCHAWLHSESRCMSAMVVGPAKFNTARAERRANAAYDNEQNYLRYIRGAVDRIMKSILTRKEQRTEAQKKNIADIIDNINSGIVDNVKGRLETLWQNHDFDSFNAIMDYAKSHPVVKNWLTKKEVTVFAPNNQLWERHAGTKYEDIKKPADLLRILAAVKKAEDLYEEDEEKAKSYYNATIKYLIADGLQKLKNQLRVRSLREAMQAIKQLEDTTGLVTIKKESKFWDYLNYELPVSNEQQGSEERQSGTIYKAEGVEVVNNLEEERIQIIFDGKPSAELIAELKHNAFKWSPRFKAWQRQNTPAALWATTDFLKKYYPDALKYKPTDEIEPKPEEKPRKKYEKPKVVLKGRLKIGDVVIFKNLGYTGVIKNWRRTGNTDDSEIIYTVDAETGEEYSMVYGTDIERVNYSTTELWDMQEPVLEVGDMLIPFNAASGLDVVVVTAVETKRSTGSDNKNRYVHSYFFKDKKLSRLDVDIAADYYRDWRHTDSKRKYLVLRKDETDKYIKAKAELLMLAFEIMKEN